jgi:23S rRNA (guanosine2251-2'-O)-methyltransferase
MGARDGDEEEIAGFHAVNEALAAGENLLWLRVAAPRLRDTRVRKLVERARGRGVRVQVVDSHHLRSRYASGGDLAAGVPAFAYAAWADVRAAVRSASSALIVVLDHLEDPQNVGAIIRNAEGAGADAVVLPDRRSAHVTAAARRAAAGAASHLRIARVPNIAAALMALKDDGCWIVGLSPDEQAAPYDRESYAPKCVLVVGAEHRGLSRLVTQRCDRLVRIPLRGRIASLNAASAAAVVLFEIARRRALG